MKEEIIYNEKFLAERIKMRYLQLRTNITSYALEFCISNYGKIGLSETEIECIKERTHTYLTYFNDFNTYEKDNFPDIFRNKL